MLDGHILDFYDANRPKFGSRRILPIMYVPSLRRLEHPGQTASPVLVIRAQTAPLAVLAWVQALWPRAVLFRYGHGRSAAGHESSKRRHPEREEAWPPLLFPHLAHRPSSAPAPSLGQYDVIGLLFAHVGGPRLLPWSGRLAAFALVLRRGRLPFKYFPGRPFFPGSCPPGGKNILRPGQGLDAIALSLLLRQTSPVWSLDPLFSRDLFPAPLQKMNEAGTPF